MNNTLNMLSFFIKTICFAVLFSMLYPQWYACAAAQQSVMVPAPITSNDPADIYLNFEGASLKSILDYLIEQRKLNILFTEDIAKALEDAKVSLNMREPVTLKQAWGLLHSLLAFNGYTVIKINNLYKIVTSDKNSKEPLTVFSSAAGIKPEDLPNDDSIIRYIFFPRNIKAKQAISIITGMLGDNAIQGSDAVEAFVITERSFNIKAAMKIITELEKSGLRESIQIIPLQYTEAVKIADLFNNEIKDKAPSDAMRFLTPTPQKKSSFFSTSVKIKPHTLKNSLILMGQENDINKIRDFIYKFIDLPMEEAVSRIHIKDIRFKEAGKIQALLENSINIKNLMIGISSIFVDVSMKAETPESSSDTNYGCGNRLIISCSKDDWKRIEKLIDKLDKPEPQVAFEVMIVDISSDTERELYSQLRLKKAGMLGKDIGFQTANLGENLVTQPGNTLLADLSNLAVGNNGNSNSPAQPGNTVLTLGSEGNTWGIIQSFITSSNANVISQPFIVVNNRKDATIKSEDVRLFDGALDSSGIQTVRKKEEQKATTEVTIKPTINTAGIVDLSIKVDIGEFVREGAGLKITRIITTRIQMGAGEVLVLGGLTKTDLSEQLSHVPILSKIPIIGNLFSSKTKTHKKTNLYVFIRPSIIKPQAEGRPDDYTQLKLDYSKYQILGADTYVKSRDPIQRWFFKPSSTNIKETVRNIKAGKFDYIDDFAENRSQPLAANIKYDPFYRSEEMITTEIEKTKNAHNGKSDKKKKKQMR